MKTAIFLSNQTPEAYVGDKNIYICIYKQTNLGLFSTMFVIFIAHKLRNKIIFFFFFFGRKLTSFCIRETTSNIILLFRFHIGCYKSCFLSQQFESSMFIQLKLGVSQALICVWKEMQILFKKTSPQRSFCETTAISLSF